MMKEGEWNENENIFVWCFFNSKLHILTVIVITGVARL